jgi:hypothetical protein
MLVGQCRLDLVGRERKLQHELDEGPQIPTENGGGKRSRMKVQTERESRYILPMKRPPFLGF